MKKRFIVFFDTLNIIFFVISIVTFIFSAVFVILSGLDMQNGFWSGMSGISVSLFSGFFIALIVRTWDMKKKRDCEKKAFLMFKQNLNDLYCEINRFYPQTKSFVKINENDTAKVPNGIVYYTDVDQGKIRAYIDFRKTYSNIKKRVDDKIEKCINSPFFYQCDTKVIDIVANLQTNGLTRNLQNISSYGFAFAEERCFYSSIFKNMKEFDSLYSNLALLLEQTTVRSLRELSEEERNEYIKDINESRSIFSDKNLEGLTQYFNGKRIN